jgi:hypothetical protein
MTSDTTDTGITTEEERWRIVRDEVQKAFVKAPRGPQGHHRRLQGHPRLGGGD